MTAEQHQQRFETLLQASEGIVFKSARWHSRSTADRADLTQEISARRWRSFGRYEDKRAPCPTWKYRIA